MKKERPELHHRQTKKEICEKVGLEQREFVKLKYITGFAKLFKNYEYSKAIDKVVNTEDLYKQSKASDNGNQES